MHSIAQLRLAVWIPSLHASTLPPCLQPDILILSGLICSGSGKSTLLDILAQRKTIGKIKGKILIAGQQPTQTFLRRYAGYVEQFDTLLPVLTVHEMLLYTAELKTPRNVSLRVRHANIHRKVLQILSLSLLKTACHHHKVKACKVAQPCIQAGLIAADVTAYSHLPMHIVWSIKLYN